ncbi:tryptophan synthase beta chain 1-like [Cynara cardunculus var. scolymus]|uniref:tryptophan synthase beta chain 1-like n=1 Tax=Cynara cardunculus var. scolymus TaxID=59895 RepID=UPI000D626540|nr:tryptophan synthase beta chain 1-like [Cynara cardunculus var. scolymus]
MAFSVQKLSIPYVGEVVVPNLEPVNLNTNLNFRSKSCTKTLSTVPMETTPTPTTGKFGRFGGKFVGEVLIAPLAELEAKFNSLLHDQEFKMELATALKDYVGRETPLYHAQKLTDHYKNINGEGPEIYLKREDLNHGGSYKMNNVIAQAILAKRMGRKSVITATSADRHGVATAAVCAKFSLDCTIFMGTRDMRRKPSNLQLMKLLGARVKLVDGSFQAAASESMREWLGNLETEYYLSGTAVGPHPIPTMVREFNSIIGQETRKQAMEKWGGKPDVLVACVGSGCNALGLFHEFMSDESVRMIGVEGGGGDELHCASLVRGEIGVYHGAMCYLLQDEQGHITTTHSVASGLEYPGVSPELSFLKDAGRVECYRVTDQEALDAYKRLCCLEGIIPALEASHALAYLEKLCPTLPRGTKVVVNCCGSGYNDAPIVLNDMP